MSAPDHMNSMSAPAFTLHPEPFVQESTYGVWVDFRTGGGAAFEDEEIARAYARVFTEAADLLAAQKARKAQAA